MEHKKASSETQLVVFNLGEESYAINIALVREIIHVQTITRVPGISCSMEGVINLRGSVIPIIDLRKRFRFTTKEHDKYTRIVVVNCKGQDVGIIVDSVAEVLRIPVDSIESATSLFNNDHLEHLLGIVKLTDRLIILLNMDQILTSQDIIALSAAEMKTKDKSFKEPMLTR
jgi:purine-binding chemotaxis protein CheW